MVTLNSPFGFLRTHRPLLCFCLDSFFRHANAKSTVNCFHSQTQSKPITRNFKKTTKESFTNPRVYMKDTIRTISNILRYSTWDSAQQQLETLNIKWDSYTINQVLKTHPPMEKSWLFFNWASGLRNFKHDQFTYTTMLDIFGEARRISSMKFVFQQMQEKGVKVDVVSYTSMLHWLSNDGDVQGSVKLWEEMKDKGVDPTVVSYTAYMKVLFDHGRVKEATKVYKEMIRAGCAPNCFTYTVLMEHLAGCGPHFFCAFRLGHRRCLYVLSAPRTFNNSDMMDKNVFLTPEIVSSVIDAYAAHERPHSAVLAYEYGKKMGIKYEKILYLSLVGLFIRTNSFPKIADIVEEMVKNGIFLGVNQIALLIYKLGCANKPVLAAKVFDFLSDNVKNTTTYTALMAAYFASRNTSKGLQIFKDMKDVGIPVVLGTYNVLLAGLEKSGRVGEFEYYRKEKKLLLKVSLSENQESAEEMACNLLFGRDYAS